MIITLPNLYTFVIICISALTTGILCNIINIQSIKKYKNNYANQKKTLCIITQDLQQESNLRQKIEEKLNNELQLTQKLNNKLSIAEERLKLLEYYHKKYEELKNELKIQLSLKHSQELQLKELNVRLEEFQSSSEKQKQLLMNNEKQLIMQFENLANRILYQNEHKITQQNKLTLNEVLHPFQKTLEEFKYQIQENFSKEEQSRHSLTYEIQNLHQLNNKITQETINLTQALKGNNKIQGNWGEIILTRALEASGMREGHEFHSQMHFKQSDGSKLQPDIIVHLPHRKEVIIDAKVSLLAYERYFNNNDPQNKKTAIAEHIHSLKSHIISLSKKNYQQLFNLNTLDYILMFVPIESACILAIEQEPSLLTDAIKHNIMIVSPTTLFIALRTINNLWQHEHQNYNAKKISEKAGRLYDKLKLFVDDLNKIGQYLNKTEAIYNSAKNKFSEGKGNIISQAENFRTLGVNIKQPINTTSTTLNTDEISTTSQISHNHLLKPTKKSN